MKTRNTEEVELCLAGKHIKPAIIESKIRRDKMLYSQFRFTKWPKRQSADVLLSFQPRQLIGKDETRKNMYILKWMGFLDDANSHISTRKYLLPKLTKEKRSDHSLTLVFKVISIEFSYLPHLTVLIARVKGKYYYSLSIDQYNFNENVL